MTKSINPPTYNCTVSTIILYSYYKCATPPILNVLGTTKGWTTISPTGSVRFSQVHANNGKGGGGVAMQVQIHAANIAVNQQDYYYSK